MKKFLAAVFAAATMATPVLAEDKVKAWRSFDSVGCMMLRECTEGVKKVSTWSDLGPDYEIAAGEIDEIVQALEKVGASVYLADEKYYSSTIDSLKSVIKNRIQDARSKPTGLGRQFTDAQEWFEPKEIHSKSKLDF